MSRIARSTCPLLVAIILAAPTAVAEATDDATKNPSLTVEESGAPSLDDLRKQIESFRISGEFADAAAIAIQLLERIETQPDVSKFDVEDARRLAATLQRINELPEAAQRELQEADAAIKTMAPHDVEEIHQQIAVRTRHLGESHVETLEWLTRLGDALAEHGRISDSELVIRQSIELHRTSLGDDHPRTLRSISYLAIVMHYHGDYPEAERLFRLVVDTRRRVQGPDHPDTRGAECNLARMLYEFGRHDEAEQLYKPLIEWYKQRYGEEYYISLYCMAGLACVQRARGEYDDAERLLRRRLEINRRLKGDDPSDDLDGMNALSQVLFDRGDLANAEKACLNALAVHKRIKDVDDHKLVELLNNLADIQHAQGRYLDAEATWRRAADSFEIVRSRISYAGLERVRFAAQESPFLRLAACLARNGKPMDAWRNLERGLARGLIDAVDVSTHRERVAMTSEEIDTRTRLLAELNEAEERLGIVERDDKASETERMQARRARSARRAALLACNKAMAEKYGMPGADPYDIERIQRRLPPDTAIVAWLDSDATPGAADSGGDHWACILRQQGPPIWIRMPGTGESARWSDEDSALAERVADQLAKRPTTRVNLSREIALLSAQRIRPLLPQLEGVEHIVVLPVGPMSRIPVQAVCDRFTVSYAPSATIFAWLAEAESIRRDGASRKSLLALGDPNYAALSDTGLKAIPGTGHEVRSIGRLFSSLGDDKHGETANSPGPKHTATTLLLQKDAAEANLQELARTDRLRQYTHIHISAHGILNDVAPWRSALLLSQSQSTDGLNRVIRGLPAYDGRLTAEQIVQTWRLDAELVTLSGCETALGRAEGGEGLVGFSQALFASGARSLVLSLWKVDDMATTLLMNRFYENLTGAFSGQRHIAGAEYSRDRVMPKGLALREAKQWLRSNSPSQNRAALNQLGFSVAEDHTALASSRAGIRMTSEQPHAAFDYSDPHFWAAFIISGYAD